MTDQPTRTKRKRFIERFFSGNVRQEQSESPLWAGLMTQEEFQQFLGLIEDYFKRRHTPVNIDSVTGAVQVAGDQQYGLQNVAQLCGQSPRKQWKRLIAEHFDRLIAAESEEAQWNDRLRDFDHAKDLLAVKIWPREYLDALSEPLRKAMMYREDLEGTISALVFDLPSSVRAVTATDIARWQREPEQLFQIGLANVQQRYHPTVSREQIGSATVTAFLGDDVFVASHALLLEQHQGCLGRHGALVGIPHRHALLCYPIDDRKVLTVIHDLIPVITGMEVEGPGSISSRLYWYDGHRFVNLPYRLDRGTLHFEPPAAFTEMLNQLHD